MSLQARRELLFRIQGRYDKANKKEKTEILNGFIQASGYGRKHAISVLSSSKKATQDSPLIAKSTRARTSKYNGDVLLALTAVWNAANQICSKRLVPFLPELVETLERCGHLSISASVKERLLQMSPASVDRALRIEKTKRPAGISTTRPGSLLKSKIKIRSFADWNDAAPGFFEADLVAHCGDSAEGSFLNTFVLTDIATSWTEFLPMLKKGEAEVIASLKELQTCMPLPLLGLDTDNGSEFINHTLLNYCEENKITFTRSRPYRKNDQAHIEQKNGNVIRRMVGYDRFEGIEAGNALLHLYKSLRLYVNFFQPSLKLISKTRNGSKTVKHYDTASTPYQRIMASAHVPTHAKEKLKTVYESLDPVALFNEIGRRQEALWKHSWLPGYSPITNDHVAPPMIPVLNKPQHSNSLEDAIASEFKFTPPKRVYKKSIKPRVPVTWRTKVDPLESLNSEIELMLRLNPHQTTKQLFQALSKKFPDSITQGQFRTLQRRVKEWRRKLQPSGLTMSIYSQPNIDTEMDALVDRALKRAAARLDKSTIFNDATTMSEV